MGHTDPALQGRCVEPPVGDGVPTSRQRGSAALSLRGAKRRGNPFSFLERRIPTPVRAGGQSRPPLQTRNDRSKTVGYMDPALQGRCVEPPVGDGVPTSRQRGSAALSLRGAKRRGNPLPFCEGRIPAPVRAGGQSRPPLQTRNDRSKTAGHMGPALQGRCVEPPVGDGAHKGLDKSSVPTKQSIGGGAKPRLCSLLHIQQLRRSSSHTSS